MEIQQAFVILDFSDSLKVVIAKVQQINNKIRVLNSCIPQNLASNTNSFQALPQPKLTHSAFLPLNNFFHPSGTTSAISLALSGGNPINLGIRRACELLTPAKCF